MQTTAPKREKARESGRGRRTRKKVRKRGEREKERDQERQGKEGGVVEWEREEKNMEDREKRGERKLSGICHRGRLGQEGGRQEEIWEI